MSKIEVNQISSQCGSTLTIGQSGDTVTLASGATQSGFGRTGTVNWDTTAKTASFTAVSGNGYFVNTTSGAITVTLPASPSGGDIVSIKDYAGTFATNNLTVGRNSSNIDGTAADAVLDTNQLSVSFVYVDGTQGWKAVNSDAGAYGPAFITATGGTVTTCGNYKIHTFTSPGTFCVSDAGNAGGSNTVDYLVIGGGGGGAGATSGGGGGAGGYRFSNGTASGCYSAGPAPLGAPALPVSVQGYPVTIGGGGAGGSSSQPGDGVNGSNTVFSSITSAGGGFGNCWPAPSNIDGNPGGSGGGGGGPGSGGTGNSPPVTPPQGNPGGSGNNPDAGGGGGGISAAGGNGSGPSPAIGGNGGNGLTSCITGSPVARGGGGAGRGGTTGGTGGTGGGGNGSAGASGDTAGTANTGGGGGGSGSSNAGSAGGSGIVIIRYKYQ